MAIKMNTMSLSIPAYNPAATLVGFHGGLSMTSLKFQQEKKKVVIVIGATGTGKSRLSIDLATHFRAEIVNCDKIQVYNGLDTVTNKVTEEECRGIPHHLLGMVDPDADFTATDFCHHANLAIGSIVEKGKIPIIAGGSNSLIESLVNDNPYFRRRYECCFLWVDVSLPILRSFVWERVDRMVEAGLVDEVRTLFCPKADYTRGIRRAIGVPEMDRFLHAERNNADKESLAELLTEAIDKIKENTYKLAYLQLKKIHKLRDSWGNLHRLHPINATDVFMKQGDEANEAWKKLVVGPSTMIVDQFIKGVGYSSILDTQSAPQSIIRNTIPMPAMAAATY